MHAHMLAHTATENAVELSGMYQGNAPGRGRQSKTMRYTLAIACIALPAVALAWPVHADVTGRARVIDGDTIEVAGTRIRLFGIDAPERIQSCQAEGELWLCGGLARLMLEDRISVRSVVCEERDQDRYGRIVAVCRAGSKDLNAWMVSEGWALAYRRYAQDYVGEEARAKAARVGVWRGDFVPPWDWRRGKRLPTAARDSGRAMETNRGTPRVGNRSSSGCRIKGNISRDGTRIYHVPGERYYERTRISTSKGERWFCSEAEARSAGWRRSRK